MTTISYAQNLEDIMLHRALKNVSKGFYIDIGAAWPSRDSVTKLFYDNGWSGLNIEPNPAFLQQLVNERHEDKNLGFAIGNKKGNLILNVIEGTGLSTLHNQVAAEHESLGWSVTKVDVDVVTLSHLFDNYVPESQEVHFLKVDVEGAELAVIEGNDWQLNRPWVVVVEATAPNKTIETYSSWESILIDNNYQFVYADGLNRFYVASEHSELTTFFEYPPNVFDDFVLSSTVHAEANYAEVLEDNKELYQELDSQRALLRKMEEDLLSISNSLSWQITSPIRMIKKIIMEIKANLKAYILRNHYSKKILIKLLPIIPALGGQRKIPKEMLYDWFPTEKLALSDKALEIYEKLKLARESGDSDANNH